MLPYLVTYETMDFSDFKLSGGIKISKHKHLAIQKNRFPIKVIYFNFLRSHNNSIYYLRCKYSWHNMLNSLSCQDVDLQFSNSSSNDLVVSRELTCNNWPGQLCRYRSGKLESRIRTKSAHKIGNYRTQYLITGKKEPLSFWVL